MADWQPPTKSDEEVELSQMNERSAESIRDDMELWTSIVQYVISDDPNAEKAVMIADKIVAARRARYPNL